MPIIGQERCSLVHEFANRCLPYFIDECVYIRIYGKVRPGEGAYVALPAAYLPYTQCKGRSFIMLVLIHSRILSFSLLTKT